MGYKNDWDINAMKHWLWIMSYEIRNPRNDGWTASSCKKEMYQLKCLIEDLYKDLPTFVGEDEWEKERLMDILKK